MSAIATHQSEDNQRNGEAEQFAEESIERDEDPNKREAEEVAEADTEDNGQYDLGQEADP